MRFPQTRTMNPRPSRSIGPTAMFSQEKFPLFTPYVSVTRIEPIHTTRVLETSTIDLARDETCFVTLTPQMLNAEIVKIPRII